MRHKILRGLGWLTTMFLVACGSEIGIWEPTPNIPTNWPVAAEGSSISVAGAEDAPPPLAATYRLISDTCSSFSMPAQLELIRREETDVGQAVSYSTNLRYPPDPLWVRPDGTVVLCHQPYANNCFNSCGGEVAEEILTFSCVEPTLPATSCEVVYVPIATETS